VNENVRASNRAVVGRAMALASAALGRAVLEAPWAWLVLEAEKKMGTRGPRKKALPAKRSPVPPALFRKEPQDPKIRSRRRYDGSFAGHGEPCVE
jgi:hypothetical protein